MQARVDHLLLEPRPLAHGAARDELEVELERVRDHLTQLPDPELDDRHAPPVGVLDHGVDDRAAQRQLVH